MLALVARRHDVLASACRDRDNNASTDAAAPVDPATHPNRRNDAATTSAAEYCGKLSRRDVSTTPTEFANVADDNVTRRRRRSRTSRR